MYKNTNIRITVFIYCSIFLLLVYRVNTYCEGDFRSCSERNDYFQQADFDSESSQSEQASQNTQGIQGNKWSDRPIFKNIRTRFTKTARKYLPSPHSELLLGMTVGIDNLKQLPKFKQMLKDTGTIHVVVVSGYNITLVFNILIKMVGTKYKYGNLAICLLGTFVYSLLSGFEPPVVRAWLMGVIVSLGTYYGRNINIIAVLLFTATVLIVVNPSYLFSLSFQLSFIATFSLVLFSSKIQNVITRITSSNNVMLEDLSATISAQILIWPLLSLKFGTVSLISPVVNSLILWTVPLITMYGSVFLIVAEIFPFLGAGLSLLIYLPLEIFTAAVEKFSELKFSTINFNIGMRGFTIYNLLIIILLFISNRKAKKASDD